MSKPKPEAYITERKGVPCVKIVLGKGFVNWAERDHQGRIQYDKPERVPRDFKNIIVPRLFAQIDEEVFGIKMMA